MIPLLLSFSMFWIQFTIENFYNNLHQTNNIENSVVQINETLFCDKYEVTNANWKFYMFCLKTVFGPHSEQYNKSIPNTDVWRNEVKCVHKLSKTYFSNWIYDHHPVVGITQQQAKDYTVWRTDRVLEKYLLEQGYMRHCQKSNSKNYFSVEKLIKGEVKLKAPPGTIIPYSEFRLPGLEDRKKILKFADAHTSGIQKDIFCNINPCGKNLHHQLLQ